MDLVSLDFVWNEIERETPFFLERKELSRWRGDGLGGGICPHEWKLRNGKKIETACERASLNVTSQSPELKGE